MAQIRSVVFEKNVKTA